MIDEKVLIERLEDKQKEAQSDGLLSFAMGFKSAKLIVKDLAEEHNNGFCEWEIVSDKDIHREYKPMCSEDGFIEITGYFDYEFCPYCGKKIKVLEKQKDTWKQQTMSRFERVE